jgi:hypothetical protein
VYRRRPLTQVEFDARCARLEQLRPDLSQTSGKRSVARNATVGGSPVSKHLGTLQWNDEWRGARDYRADSMPWVDADGRVRIEELQQQAKILGLFAQVHGDGTSQHLHIQSRPRDNFDYTRDGWNV